jgi:hypothetical protein
LTSNGARPSRKQLASRPKRLILRSASRNRSAPLSLDTRPAVTSACTQREKWAVNENLSWIHSVIKGRSFSRHLATSRQRSYAMKSAAFCYLFFSLPVLIE